MNATLRKALILAAIPFAVFMVHGCGGGGGGTSGGGGSGGGGSSSSASSSSSSSSSSYVAATAVTVSTRTGVFRGDTVVTGLKGGNYVVAWADRAVVAGAPDTSGFAILLRIISPAGAAVTAELTANTTTTGDQNRPSILALDNGGFVVAWEDASTASRAIRAQIFDANGAKSGAEFKVNTTTAADGLPSQIIPVSGGFMVVYRDRAAEPGGVTTRDGVRAQIYTNTGAVVGSELLLKSFPTGFIGGTVPFYMAVGLSDGTFVGTYDDNNIPNTSGVLKSSVQRYTALGVASGSSITLAGGQEAFGASLVSLENARFVAQWTVAGPSAYNLRSQTYASNGSTYGATVSVTNSTTVSANSRGGVGLTGGNYVLLYEVNNRLTGQVITPEGTKYLAEFEAVSGISLDAVTVGAAPSGFAISWADNSGTGPNKPIVLRIYTRQ